MSCASCCYCSRPPTTFTALLLFLLSALAASEPAYLYHSVLLGKRVLSPQVPPPSSLVLVHGLLGSSRNFASWARLLQEKVGSEADVIVLELRNHGRSSMLGPMQMDYTQMAGDVLHTLEKLNVRRAHLIGHSVGGKVVAAAALLAVNHKTEITTMTMMDISPVKYSAQDAEFKDVLSTIDFLVSSQAEIANAPGKAEAYAVVQRAISDKSLQLFLQSNLQPRSSAAAAAGGGGFEWKFLVDGIDSSRKDILDFPSSEVSNTRVPALILKGTNSNFCRSTHIQEIQRRLPLFTISSVSDAGHWLHIEQPERTTTTIADFISKAQQWRDSQQLQSK